MMTKTEFLQILRDELDGRVPYSVIQENLSYYDTYINSELGKGISEDRIIEELGGPRLIARTIVDATLDTEDRPDGFQTFGGSQTYDGAGAGSAGRTSGGAEHRQEQHSSVHYLDFSKWYVRLLAGLAVFAVLILVITVIFSVLGLAGWVLSVTWPILLVYLIFRAMKGPRE